MLHYVFIFAMGIKVARSDDVLPHSSWAIHAKGQRHMKEVSFEAPSILSRVLEKRKAGTKKLARDCAGAMNCSELDVYEFGVYLGRSMRALALAFNASATPLRTMWGFDSFSGLPEESPGTVRSQKSKGEWQSGDFSVAEVLGSHSYREVKQKLLDYIADPRVQLVRGFYNESLTPELAQRTKPALYVDIDCDLYVSTKQALDWLFRYDKVVPGTVIYFDDMKTGGRGGELQAHLEIVDAYQVKYDVLHPEVFQVRSVGGRSISGANVEISGGDSNETSAHRSAYPRKKPTVKHTSSTKATRRIPRHIRHGVTIRATRQHG